MFECNWYKIHWTFLFIFIFKLQHALHPQKSFETLQTVFDPAFCLDYIKAGVEAIIEDEVTSRFEAEELKVKKKKSKINLPLTFVTQITLIYLFVIIELESAYTNK